MMDINNSNDLKFVNCWWKCSGSAEMVNRFEDWALQSVQNVNLERPSDSVSTVKTTDVMELELQKMKVFNLRQQPVVKYPSNTRRGLNVVQCQ